MMNEILFRLSAREILVADGAMGSLLMEKGLQPGECPESFNLTQPELLTQIATSYFDVGAMIIQTNTFGGSPLKLQGYGLADQTEEINEAAVEAVRKAVANQAYVSGSCGPSGRTLQPHGDTDPEQVYRSFKRQLRALAKAGVDCFCIETMTDLTEAQLAIKAAKEVAREIPIIATMTFDKTPRGYFTIMGVDIQTAARDLTMAGADIVGSNCGQGSENMIEIAHEFRKYTRLPILIQPNAGLPELEGDKAVYRETPEVMAANCVRILEEGARIIGGCCGTTPEHIRAIRRIVNRYMDRRMPS
jgi:5-methyltetrahydrofolate--homocysteine methyltransferase